MLRKTVITYYAVWYLGHKRNILLGLLLISSYLGHPQSLLEVDSTSTVWLPKTYVDDSEPTPVTAWYRGGREKLTSDIAENCADIRNHEVISGGVVFLYRGVVHRDRSLRDVKPILGADSVLSKDIQKCVEATSGSWRPALQGGRPVKSMVDICVQINQNLEIVVSFYPSNSIDIHAVHAQPHAFTEEFTKYPDIEYFRVEMRGDSVSFIEAYLKDDTTTADGRSILSVAYDFRFEGDHYFFRQKHSAAMMELSPNRIDPAKIVNERSRRSSVLCAFIYPDSVAYEYRSTANGFVIHAAYRDYEDFKYLGEELQHHAVDIALEKDSILFFQALIGLDGNIETIELIQGRGGKYTDEIIDFFMKQQGAWRPLNKDGRMFRSLTDICVRLGSDGKIYTSHSLSLRQPRIEIKDLRMMVYPTY